MRQPQSLPGASATLRMRAGSPGASDTAKRSRGCESPSPSALMNASLRVQHWKKPSGRSRASSARYASFSTREKKRAASSSASGNGRTASTSMPTSRPRAKAYTATSSQWETLKCRSACRGASAGLPCAPYANSISSGASPSRSASSWRSRERASVNLRRSRANANRAARCRSAADNSVRAARETSGLTSSPATTTSTASTVYRPPHAERNPQRNQQNACPPRGDAPNGLRGSVGSRGSRGFLPRRFFVARAQEFSAAAVDHPANRLWQQADAQLPALLLLMRLHQRDQPDKRAIDMRDAAHFQPDVLAGEERVVEAAPQAHDIRVHPRPGQANHESLVLLARFCGRGGELARVGPARSQIPGIRKGAGHQQR